MISVSHIAKSYGRQQVLRDVSFEIGDGDRLCILGGSGSGKSVLLRNTLGLEHPDHGEVLIDGKEVHTLSESAWHALMKEVGVVFQGAALFDSLPVWENVGIRMLEERTGSAESIRNEVVKTLKKVKLDETILDKLPSQLSGGMQKRIGIARAVIHKPKYLFYDEPTTGLDPASADAIDELMEEMASEPGRTSVIVTHDLATVKRIANRVIMLHKGLVRFDGTPEAFFESDDEVVKSFLKRKYQ